MQGLKGVSLVASLTSAISQVCKKADMEVKGPFTTVIRVEDDPQPNLPTMSMAKLIMSMVDSGQIELIPQHQFSISCTFVGVGITYTAMVREFTHAGGMCSTSIDSPGHDVTKPFPLGVGDHQVVVVRGRIERIPCTGPSRST